MRPLRVGYRWQKRASRPFVPRYYSAATQLPQPFVIMAITGAGVELGGAPKVRPWWRGSDSCIKAHWPPTWTWWAPDRGFIYMNNIALWLDHLNCHVCPRIYIVSSLYSMG